MIEDDLTLLVKKIHETYEEGASFILDAYTYIDDAIVKIRKANALNWSDEPIENDYLEKTECEITRLLDIIGDQLMNLSRAASYLARDDIGID